MYWMCHEINHVRPSFILMISILAIATLKLTTGPVIWLSLNNLWMFTPSLSSCQQEVIASWWPCHQPAGSVFCSSRPNTGTRLAIPLSVAVSQDTQWQGNTFVNNCIGSLSQCVKFLHLSLQDVTPAWLLQCRVGSHYISQHFINIIKVLLCFNLFLKNIFAYFFGCALFWLSSLLFCCYY